MIIKTLSLENFKKFNNKKYVFKDINLISGKNGSGKTTIKDAIFFCLYNRTSTGSSADTSKLIKDGEASCTVEMEFEIDGQLYKLKRERSKKTTTIKFLDGSQTEEDSIVTQRDLESILPEFELFQSVFNVRYFMSMPDKDKREFILKYTDEVDKKEIFKKLAKDKSDDLIKAYNLHFENLDSTHKELLQTKRLSVSQFENNKAIINDSTPIEQVPFDDKELDKAKEQSIKIEKEKSKSMESMIAWQNYENAKQQKKETEDRNKRLQTEIDSIIMIEEIRKPDNRKLTNLIAKKNEIKNVIKIPEGKCPTCLQKIDSKHKNKIDRINYENINKAKELEQEIDKEKTIYDKKYEAYIDNEKKKQKISLLKNQITPPSDLVKPPKKIIYDELKEKELRDTITQLEIKKNESESSYRQEQERLNKIKALKKENEEINKSINELNFLIKIFSPSGIKSEEMRIKLEPIIKLFNSYIPDSKIETIQLLKNELSTKEVFQVFSNNKEYSKMSLGEKTKMDIAISKIIDKLSGDTIGMYFIDNAEIVDTLPDLRKQSFAAKVNNNNLKIKTI